MIGGSVGLPDIRDKLVSTSVSTSVITMVNYQCISTCSQRMSKSWCHPDTWQLAGGKLSWTSESPSASARLADRVLEHARCSVKNIPPLDPIYGSPLQLHWSGGKWSKEIQLALPPPRLAGHKGTNRSGSEADIPASEADNKARKIIYNNHQTKS